MPVAVSVFVPVKKKWGRIICHLAVTLRQSRCQNSGGWQIDTGPLQRSRLAGAHLTNPDCPGEAGLSLLSLIITSSTGVGST